MLDKGRGGRVMPKLPKENCLYRIGDFRLDARSRVLLRGSEPVRMPLKATEILLTLVEHSGDVVTKEELLHAVWPDKIVDEANLKQNIAVIRKVLDVQPGSPGHIETFVGRGYRIVGIVEEVVAEPSSAIARPQPHDELPPPYKVLPAVVFPAAVRPRPSGWIVTALVLRWRGFGRPRDLAGLRSSQRDLCRALYRVPRHPGHPSTRFEVTTRRLAGREKSSFFMAAEEWQTPGGLGKIARPRRPDQDRLPGGPPLQPSLVARR